MHDTSTCHEACAFGWDVNGVHFLLLYVILLTHNLHLDHRRNWHTDTVVCRTNVHAALVLVHLIDGQRVAQHCRFACRAQKWQRETHYYYKTRTVIRTLNCEQQ